MTPAEYLDAAKQRLSIPSDYALAKIIGHQTSHVADFRNGKRPIPDDVKLWLAKTLEMDVASIVGDLGSQREKNPQRAEFLRSFVQSTWSKAAVWVLAIATAATIAPSETYANDTFKVSSPTLQAAPLQALRAYTIGIM